MTTEDHLHELVRAGVLSIQIENHLFEHTTAPVLNTWFGVDGVRAGRRCRKCLAWAMGERPGDSAPEVCPKAVMRYVSKWGPTGTGVTT